MTSKYGINLETLLLFYCNGACHLVVRNENRTNLYSNPVTEERLTSFRSRYWVTRWAAKMVKERGQVTWVLEAPSWWWCRENRGQVWVRGLNRWLAGEELLEPPVSLQNSNSFIKIWKWCKGLHLYLPAKRGFAATIFRFFIEGRGGLWLVARLHELLLLFDEELVDLRRFIWWWLLQLRSEGVLRRLDRVGVALERDV